MPPSPKASAKCGATTASGTKCRRRPVPGHHRCDSHGGAVKSVTDPIRWQAKGYRNMSAEGEQALHEVMQQADLLDGRRALAMLDLLLRQIAIPSAELIERKAERVMRKRLTEAETPADTAETPEEQRRWVVDDVDREEAMRELLGGSMTRFERLAGQIQQAIRTARVEALFAGVVAPMIKEISSALLDVAKVHIPNPKHRELFIGDFTRRISIWVAHAMSAAHAEEQG